MTAVQLARRAGAEGVVASHRQALIFFIEKYYADWLLNIFLVNISIRSNADRLNRLLAGRIGRAELERSCCEYLEVKYLSEKRWGCW